MTIWYCVPKARPWHLSLQVLAGIYRGMDCFTPLTPTLSLKGRGSCGAEIVNELVNTYSHGSRYLYLSLRIRWLEFSDW